MPYRRGKKYIDFQVTLVPTYSYMYANAGRLQLDVDELARISNMIFEYNNVANRYVDPNKQDAVVVAEMMDVYERLSGEFRRLRRQIKNDDRVRLTAADIAALGLKRRAEHYRRAERPLYAPLNSVGEYMPLGVKVLTYTMDSQGERRVSIPERHMMIEYRVAVTDSLTPPEMAEYGMSGSTSRARYTVLFAREEHGRYAHIITAYANLSGERGPWSAPLTVTIQG